MITSVKIDKWAVNRAKIYAQQFVQELLKLNEQYDFDLTVLSILMEEHAHVGHVAPHELEQWHIACKDLRQRIRDLVERLHHLLNYYWA